MPGGVSHRELAEALVAVGRRLHAQGALPATSGNLSVRAGADAVLVTASGLDKGALGVEDLLRVGLDGAVRGRVDAEGSGSLRPSAETALHLQLYRWAPGIGAVLHVHTEAATVLSLLTEADAVELTGFELLKALAGVRTHEAVVTLPVFANTQDVDALAAEVDAHAARLGMPHGYLIRGHGLYAWGADLAEAVRHVEALDFLFRCKLALRREVVA